LTPFWGDGAGPSDTEPAKSGGLMLNPMATLATAEKLTHGRSAKKAIEQSPNRKFKGRTPIFRLMINI
jgi:hypothetical protein